MKRNGWTLLGSGRTNDYFAVPAEQNRKDIIVAAIVPIDAEIERLASDLHAKGELVADEIDGWIINYSPARDVFITPLDYLNRGIPTELQKSFTMPASFMFGVASSWSVSLKWEDGNDASPCWYRSDKNIVSTTPDDMQIKSFSEGVERKITNASSTLPDRQFPLYEGAIQQELVNEYERNLEARNRCINHYGLSCMVCGFNFANRYGVIGAGYIQVHHLRPLSEIRDRYEVDPIQDLRPVCSNCHTMLHRRTPPYTLDELQSILNT